MAIAAATADAEKAMGAARATIAWPNADGNHGEAGTLVDTLVAEV